MSDTSPGAQVPGVPGLAEAQLSGPAAVTGAGKLEELRIAAAMEQAHQAEAERQVTHASAGEGSAVCDASVPQQLADTSTAWLHGPGMVQGGAPAPEDTTGD